MVYAYPMNRYEIADAAHADLPTRAELIEDGLWAEIDRQRAARRSRKPFDPDTDWDHTYDLPPF